MNITEKVKEKILPYLIDTDECIEYKTLNKDGYPSYRLKIDNINYHYSMHRVMYQIFYNDNIKKEDVICHKCDNTKCVNPKHLFKGTHNDNVQDKVSKGRQAKGKNNGRYKTGYKSIYEPKEKPKPEFTTLYSRSITKELAEELKIVINNRNGRTLKSISEEYNLPYQTIRDISCGRTYKLKNP